MKKIQKSYNSTLKKKSTKQIKLDRYYIRLVMWLVRYRAHYSCEVCGKFFGEWGIISLSGHHIKFRSKGRVDTIDNLLIAGAECHDNSSFTGIFKDGKPMSIEDQHTLCDRLNEKYGIFKLFEEDFQGRR